MINILTRYNFNTAKIANSLLNYQITNRARILFTQALLYPIQIIADKFKEKMIELHIEASMTSQVFYFEWFLNRKFKKYFTSDLDAIIILDAQDKGQPIFMQSENNKDNFLTAYESEKELKEDLKPLYKTLEEESKREKNFTVFIPDNTTIPTKDLINMVRFYVEKYKVAGKTYDIKIMQNK